MPANTEILVDERIRDKFADRDFGNEFYFLAQGIFDDFVLWELG